MATKKLNIHNPKKLNSTNHCLSGAIIVVEYKMGDDKEYVYEINANYHELFTLTISRLVSDGEIAIGVFCNKQPNKTHYIKKHINFCNDRGVFLDWIVKLVEADSNQFFPF